MSSTTSGPLPPPTQRERILAANIHISILQFIAALLLTLMLLWHISTVTLVEQYYMPQWWHDEFMSELKKGWRIAMWTMVLFMVPLDCAHTLLCLDWWCLLLYGRDDGSATAETTVGPEGGGDEEEQAAYIRKRKLERPNEIDRASDALTLPRLPSESSPSSATARTSTPSTPPTYHPLLHHRLSSRTQDTLLSLFDLTMLIILTGHIMSYFLSLPQYFSHCNTASVLAAPNFLFGDTGKFLNMRQGCIKLNVDIHVAGGFSMFMAIVLGALHVASMVTRVCEYRQLGRKDMDRTRDRCVPANEDVNKQDMVSMDGLEDPEVEANPALCKESRSMTADQLGSMAPTISLRSAESIDNEERGTGVRTVDWSAEGARLGLRLRARRTEDSSTETEDSKWSGAFLECLVP